MDIVKNPNSKRTNERRATTMISERVNISEFVNAEDNGDIVNSDSDDSFDDSRAETNYKITNNYELVESTQKTNDFKNSPIKQNPKHVHAKRIENNSQASITKSASNTFTETRANGLPAVKEER